MYYGVFGWDKGLRLEPVIVIHNGLAGVYAANVKIYKAD